MTDEQIIKALECCTLTKGGCMQCPLNINDSSDCFTFAIQKHSLDLINRLKKEIERLTTLEEKADKHCREVCEPHFHETIKSLEVELKAMRGSANSYKAEVDRLTAMIEAAEDHYNPLPFKVIFDEKIAEARSEAIREFAESLKKKYENHIVCTWTVLNKEIDNLVKEMTEDKP